MNNKKLKYILFLLIISILMNCFVFAHPRFEGYEYNNISEGTGWEIIYDPIYNAYTHHESNTTTMQYIYDFNTTTYAYLFNTFELAVATWNNVRFPLFPVIGSPVCNIINQNVAVVPTITVKIIDENDPYAYDGQFIPQGKYYVGPSSEEHAHWTSAWITLNTAKLWSTTDPTLLEKYKGTCVHELGHAIGLDHVPSTSSIMHGNGLYRTVYTPQTVDIKGAAFISGNHTSHTCIDDGGGFWHNINCTSCGATGFEHHMLDLKGSNLFNGKHKRQCTKCLGYINEVHLINNYLGCTYEDCFNDCGYEAGSHSGSTYASTGLSSHTVKCVCGDQSTVAHTYTNGVCVCGQSCTHSGSYTYISNGSSGHLIKCGYCQTTITTGSHIMINPYCQYYFCGPCGYSTGSAHGNYTYTNNGNGTHSQTCVLCSTAVSTSAHDNLTYTNNGSSGHTQTCGTCQAAISTSAHSLTNGVCTFQSCSSCGYSTGSSSHNYAYTNNGNGTHTQTCGNCQATSTSAHTMINGACTYKSCVCGYSTGSAHSSYTYTNNGSSNHTKNCGVCGSQVTESHSLSNAVCKYYICGPCGYSEGTIHAGGVYFISNGSSGHTMKCYDCGIASSSGHIWVTTPGGQFCGPCGYS